MAVRFLLPAFLRTFADARSGVDIVGAPPTVGEALAALGALHPGVLDRVLTEQGVVRRHVNIFVGDESIKGTGGLDTPLYEGATISIVPAVSGG